MEPRQRGVLAGLILVIIGMLLLVGNVTELGGWVFVLGIGVAFLAGYFMTGRYGLLVAGCIVSAVGFFAALQDIQNLGRFDGAWFFAILGLGFFAIYVLAQRWEAWWPLIPSAVLVLLGGIVALANLVTIPDLADWQGVSRWWPAFLILFGLWFAIGRYLNARVRLVSGLAIGLVMVVYALFAVAVGVASQAEASQGGWLFSWGGNMDFKETVERSAFLPAGGKLIVQNSSGNTTVRRGDVQEVKLVATKHVWLWSDKDARRSLDNLAVDVQEGNGVVEISWRRSGSGGWFNPVSGSVDFEITVPVSVSVESKSSSGNVEMQDIDGDVKAEASSGRIDLKGIGGAVSATAHSGSVQLQGVRGATDVDVSSGRISVQDPGGTFRLASHSGSIEVTGDIRTGGTITASSGTVRLVPTLESAFRLDAHTRSGQVTVDPRHKVEHGDRQAKLVTVGSGGPTVSVQVSSGNVNLQ